MAREGERQMGRFQGFLAKSLFTLKAIPPRKYRSSLTLLRKKSHRKKILIFRPEVAAEPPISQLKLYLILY
jgi:hypothetical protein